MKGAQTESAAVEIDGGTAPKRAGKRATVKSRPTPARATTRDAKLDAQWLVTAVIQTKDRNAIINGARGDGVVMTGQRLLELTGYHPDHFVTLDYIEPYHAAQGD
jgi:hypothetical protein